MYAWGGHHAFPLRLPLLLCPGFEYRRFCLPIGDGLISSFDRTYLYPLYRCNVQKYQLIGREKCSVYFHPDLSTSHKGEEAFESTPSKGRRVGGVVEDGRGASPRARAERLKTPAPVSSGKGSGLTHRCLAGVARGTCRVGERRNAGDSDGGSGGCGVAGGRPGSDLEATGR